MTCDNFLKNFPPINRKRNRKLFVTKLYEVSAGTRAFKVGGGGRQILK